MVQNPHSVQADTHDYFLPRPGRLSSKSGADIIISCGDQRLVGSARQCPTLAIWALRLRGVVFQMLHQNSYPGRLVFLLLRRWGGVGVVFQKVVSEFPRLDRVVFQKLEWCSKQLSRNPHVAMGWCSKSWGGVLKNCPRILTLYTTGLFFCFAMFYN